MEFPDVMETAIQFCAGYGQTVARNRTLVISEQTLERHAKTFVNFDRIPMRDLLNADANPFHYLFGMRVEDTNFNPVTMALQYDLNTDILFANTMVSGVTNIIKFEREKRPTNTASQVLPALVERLDGISFRSAMLAETFRHMCAISRDTQLASFIPRFKGNMERNYITGLERARLETELTRLIATYRARCGAVSKTLISNALNPEKMRQMIGHHTFCDYPMWFAFDKKDIGRFFNDVWMSPPFAEQQMKILAKAQAEAISAQR